MTKPILVVALAAIFFINFYQASDSQNYGSFFMTRDDFANSDPSSDDTNNIIDESFHKCSNKKSCGKVAENFKTNKCKIVAVGQELPCEKQNTRIWHKEIRSMFQIEILSAGFEDAGGSNSIIKINDIDYSKKQRGFNIVVMSEKNGDIIGTERFDTCFTYKEGDRMMAYLSSTQNGRIVLVSAHGDAALSMTSRAEEVIHALGATTRLTAVEKWNDTRYGGSFALVAKKGGDKPSWFAEKAADRKKGPSRIKVQIPVGWY